VHMASATKFVLRRRNRRNVYLLSWNTLSTSGIHSILTELPKKKYLPRIFLETLYVMNRQEGIDKRSVDSIDESIYSKDTITNICVGG
jgi:hypothetical protein